MARIWILIVAAVMLVACGQEAPAPGPDIVYQTVEVPAAQNDPAVLMDLVQSSGVPFPYRGVMSLEENIFTSDVIARVSLVAKRASVVQRPVTASEHRLEFWATLLEFRFDVHEYLKGRGPDEIGGLVYLEFHTEARAREAVTVITDAHDSRWDSREAIVFLMTHEGRVGLRSLPSRSDQYWFGNGSMGYGSDFGFSEGYTVASIYSKLWLPEANPSSTSSGSGNRAKAAPAETAFLLDATASTGGSGARGQTATLPTINLGNLKAKITDLETEASAGGTAEYRECVGRAYMNKRMFTYMVSQSGSPLRQRDVSIASGAPVRTLLWENDEAIGRAPDQTGRYWFDGPAKSLVTTTVSNIHPYPLDHSWIRYTRRYVTTRPLPAGGYSFFNNGLPSNAQVCGKAFPITRNQNVVNLTVTSGSTSTLHEAFFDPVSIGTAVGADASNGVLEPAAFTVGGASATITSLKWDDGTVTLALSPADADLGSYVLDFIDTSGTTILSLSSANVSTTALTWAVPDQPWAEGDLLMLRLR